jgi:hypothetical protein
MMLASSTDIGGIGLVRHLTNNRRLHHKDLVLSKSSRLENNHREVNRAADLATASHHRIRSMCRQARRSCLDFSNDRGNQASPCCSLPSGTDRGHHNQLSIPTEQLGGRRDNQHA